MYERERKYRLRAGQRDAIAAILRASGRRERSGTESDVLYDHPALRLRDADEVVRVRSRSLEPTCELTFKGAREYRGGDKVRRELTVRVDASIGELLAAIGFVEVQRIAKSRELYAAFGCEITLDELSGLGGYCEIEAIADDVDLGGVAARLGLDDAQIEPRTYAELVTAAIR